MASAGECVVGVGKEMSEDEKKLLESGHSFMEIDSRYASFKVMRKKEEEGDANFPVDMSAAMQLFIMAGLRDNASACKACMDAQIKILEKGPDGKTQHRLGSGAICWHCGYVGLPRNNDAFDAGKPKRKGTHAVCSGCGSDAQTNLVSAVDEGKLRLPWIQIHAEDSEDQMKAAKCAGEMEGKGIPTNAASAGGDEAKAAKRAEIERQVAEARARQLQEKET